MMRIALLLIPLLISQKVSAELIIDLDQIGDLERSEELIFDDTQFFEDFEQGEGSEKQAWLENFTVRISQQVFGQINTHSVEFPTGQKFFKKREIEHNRLGINVRYSSAFASKWLLQGTGQARFYWAQDYEFEANKDHVETEYRVNELFVQKSFGHHSIKFGRQTVVWGETIGNSVLDVINHAEFRDFSIIDIEDARLNQWMLVWDVYRNQNQLSSFLNLYPEFNPAPVEGSPLFFALPFKLKEYNRDGDILFEAGVQWRKSYETSDVAIMMAYLYENQLRYRLSDPELSEISGIKNDFLLLGLSANRAIGKLLLTIDLAVKHGILPDESMFAFSILETITENPKDQLGASFGFEYGMTSTEDISLNMQVKKTINERTGVDSNFTPTNEGPHGQWLVRYSNRMPEKNIVLTATLQGDLKRNSSLVSIEADFALSDQLEMGWHVLYIASNRNSQMVLFDDDLRLGVTVAYSF